MSTGRMFLLAFAAALTIGATDSNMNDGASRSLVYKTPRVVAQQPLSDGLEVRYTAAIEHRSGGEARSVTVEINVPNVTSMTMSGTPERIEAIANAVVSAGAALDAAPTHTEADGRDIALEATVEDTFPDVGFVMITTPKYITFRRIQRMDISVPRSDSARLAQSLREAASLAKHLP